MFQSMFFGQFCGHRSKELPFSISYHRSTRSKPCSNISKTFTFGGARGPEIFSRNLNFVCQVRD